MGEAYEVVEATLIATVFSLIILKLRMEKRTLRPKKRSALEASVTDVTVPFGSTSSNASIVGQAILGALPRIT